MKSDAIITPEQCRAARGWLNWTQFDLATKSHVSLSTIRDFESGRRTPIQNNRTAIRQVIEDHGIKLVFFEETGATGIAFIPRSK